MAAMAAANPNFVAEQQALYEAARAQAAARNAQAAQPDAEAALAAPFFYALISEDL